jgi:hypothetical protein
MSYDDSITAGRRFLGSGELPSSDVVLGRVTSETRSWQTRQDAAMAMLLAMMAPFALRILNLSIQPWVTDSKLEWLFPPSVNVPNGLLVCAMLATAAFLLRRPSVGAQLTARAILVAFVFLNVTWFAAMMDAPHSVKRFVLLWGSVAVLVLAGTRRLDPDDGPFQPLTLRRPLMVSLVATGATSLVHLHDLIYQLTDGPELALANVLDAAWPVLAFAVAAVGIYRLRVWGVLLNVGVTVCLGASWGYGTFFTPAGPSSSFGGPHLGYGLAILVVQGLAVVPTVVFVVGRALRRRGIHLGTSRQYSS